MPLETYFEAFDRRDWEVEEPDGTVRIAVLGIGGFAKNRALPAIAEARYCEATVLVTGSPGTASAVAESFDIDTVIDYDTFLAGETAAAYDAVYIATPNATHGDYAIRAAAQGKHVICEKPLDASMQEARRIIDACREAGVTLMTAYRLQLEPAVRRTRELMHDGVIGKIVQLHAGFSHNILEYAGPDTWRLDPELAGGGALMDLGIYPLNTIRFLLEDDPVSTSATTHSIDEAFTHVDEHVAFLLEFPGGITASCSASFNAHGTSGLRIVGSEGMVSISSPFGGVVPHDIYVECGDVAMEYRGSPADEVVEEFAYFGYCVLTGDDPAPDGEDGLRDLEAIDAIYEAAETGKRVAIE